jgi:hypothetical protein
MVVMDHSGANLDLSIIDRGSQQIWAQGDIKGL